MREISWAASPMAMAHQTKRADPIPAPDKHQEFAIFTPPQYDSIDGNHQSKRQCEIKDRRNRVQKQQEDVRKMRLSIQGRAENVVQFLGKQDGFNEQ